MKNVLITGSGGFIGRFYIANNSHKFQLTPISLRNREISELDLTGIDTILHLAGIAHRLKGEKNELYYSVNYNLTKNLALKAKEHGVKHFIFVSTIKVYGNVITDIKLDSPLTPDCPYGKSKLMAEKFLMNISSSDFRICIIRPPLIYGPSLKGNLALLQRLITYSPLIPLLNINNSRSVLGLENLSDFFDLVIERQIEGIYLIQDKVPLSVSEIAQYMSTIINPSARFISMPLIIQKLFRILYPQLYNRLFSSLVIDDSRTRNTLNYSPRVDTYTGIRNIYK